MNKDGLLSISELARFARTSRTALIYYDNMGLITPLARGENDYRYYSDHQIATVNLVRTLKELGMPLKDIAKVVGNRTPETIMRLFDEQTKIIDGNIEKLQRVKQMIKTLEHSIETAREVDENVIELHHAEASSIFLGPQCDYSKGKTLDDALLEFYVYCENTDSAMDLNYSAWGMFNQERIERHDWKWPDRFYFSMPNAPAEKPAGLYLTGYTRGDYGQTDELYSRLMVYMRQNELIIDGPAYEEYPLNEISIINPARYLIRASIRVRKRHG
ncbi:MAG: MerR family transcriptional regulator [Oscillospiraceae bacterium]|jgi:DNA-binding transcriptional MerR regulator|nr:MerR family transcriptional regulator [Oscillospiraceae bacterium]